MDTFPVANPGNTNTYELGQSMERPDMGLPKKGDAVEIEKVWSFKTSSVPVGKPIEGFLAEDINRDRAILFEDGFHTSQVSEIVLDKGETFFVTNTSVYKLNKCIAENQEVFRGVNKSPLSRDIESNWTSQPQSVRDIYLETEGDLLKIFVKAEKFDDREFIFSSVYQDPDGGRNIVMALTKDEYNQNKYATRVFYKSKSDDQWRAIPGLRPNGHFMKGQEDNPRHHYVQSSKLDKRIHNTLDNLPEARDKYSLNPLNYLPQEHNRYSEENNFTEKYKFLKNPEWAKYQRNCQSISSIYNYCVVSANAKRDYTCDGSFYKWLEGMEKSDNLGTLKQAIGEASKNPEIYEKIKKATIYDLGCNSDPNVARLAQIYDREISALIEDLFKLNIPESIIPNFSEENCIGKYTRKSSNGDNTQIEEYKVNSTEGDELVFAMAYDKKGNIYIDNIYDPREPITSYGTMEEIVQMGYLIYKPEDYKFQALMGFPKEFLGEENGRYINVNKLWRENILIIDKFSNELEKRKNKSQEDSGRFKGKYS